MPEIKHNFTAGKMNKDLDERLVKNGEYRDALNIQVRTGDDNAAGTTQNIKGNLQVGSSYFAEWMSDNAENWEVSNNKPQYPTCVGSTVDEKSNKAYFFFGSSLHPPVLATGPQVTGKRRVYVDTIIEQDTSNNATTPIVVDHFATIDTVRGVLGSDNYYDGSITSNIFSTNGFSEIPVEDTSFYRVGMNLRVLNSSGEDILTNGPVKIKAIDDTNNKLLLHETVYDDLSIGGVWFVFEIERTLNFSQGELLSENHEHALITGINVIDNLLFWTDNYTEPKKINIDRCKKGSNPSGAIQNGRTHTKLYIEDPITKTLVDASTISHQLSSDPTNSDLKEEHITVIRKSPRTPPTLEMSKYSRPVEFSTITIDHTFVDVVFNTTLVMGEEHVIQDESLLNSQYIAGDILKFTQGDESDEDEIIKFSTSFISYVENGEDVEYTTNSIKVKMLADNALISTENSDWNITIELEKPLFEFKFPRFGYRYKYEDGEYSTFSPWSEIAFLPDDFEYNSLKGYNLGMINTVRNLKVKDFIPYKIPLDVSSIDILFKTTDSANVYIVDTIDKVKDNQWVSFSPDGQNTTLEIKTGELKITSEMIHRVVAENQSLRTWDNVPRMALAQEIIASRLIYGNYTQGYDLNSSFNLVPKVVSEDSPDQLNPKKSIKSLRDYKVGVVFGDKYGRETPVLTSKYTTSNSDETSFTSLDGGITVDKFLSASQNKIEVQQFADNDFTTQNDWIDYAKYYIKETSNEYYNLIMDRWYDSGDGGTIWMSFNSADRNKVTEEDYLILKNKHGSEDPVLEKARYKILSIKNEAPDFIKKRYYELPTFTNVNANAYGLTPQNSGTVGNPDPIPGSVWQNTSYTNNDQAFGMIQNTQAVGLWADTVITLRHDHWRASGFGSFTEGEYGAFIMQGDPFYGTFDRPDGEVIEGRIVGQMLESGTVTAEMTSDWKELTSWSNVIGAQGGTVNFVQIHFADKFDQLGDGGVDMLTRFNNAEIAGDETFNADLQLEINGGTTIQGVDSVLGIQNGLRYLIEFRKVKIDNKPEFDGKFFVKIKKDLIVSQNISILGFNQSYNVTGNLPIGYLNSSYINERVGAMQPGLDGFGEAVFDDSSAAGDWFYGAYQGLTDTPSNFDTGGNGGNEDFDYVDNSWEAFQADSFYENNGAPFVPTEDDLRVPSFIGVEYDNINIPCIGEGQDAFNTIGNAWNQFGDISVMGACHDNTLNVIGEGPDTGTGEDLRSKNETFWSTWQSNQSDRVFIDSATVAYGGYCNALTSNTDPNLNSFGGRGDGIFSEALMSWYSTGPTTSGVEVGKGWKPFDFGQGVLTIPNSTQYGVDSGQKGSITLSCTMNGDDELDGLPSNFVSLTQAGQIFSWENDTSDDGDPFYYEVLGYVFYSEGKIINYLRQGIWEQDSDAPPPYNETFIKACDAEAIPSNGAASPGSHRYTYVIEFRKINKTNGLLTTQGMDLSQFDPRSYLRHDGNNTINIQLRTLQDIGNLSGGEASVDAERGACWETEPKEDLDLELYYEATSALPVVLNKTNAFDFAMPNSTVEVYRTINNVKAIQSTSGYNNPRLNNIHFTHEESDTAIMAIVGDDFESNLKLLSGPTIGDELHFHRPDGIITKASITKMYRPIDESPGGAFQDITTQDTTSGVISGPKAFEEVLPVDYNITPIAGGDDIYYGFNVNNVPEVGTAITSFLVEVNGVIQSIPLQDGIKVSGYGASLVVNGVTTVIVYFEVNGISNNSVLNNALQSFVDTLSGGDTYETQGIVQSMQSTGYYGIDVDVWKNPVTLAWHNCYSFGNGVESDRIADDYNAPQIDNGIKASSTFSGYQEEKVPSGLIYSGLYNSTSQVNNLNEFNQAEKITKQINPRHGSIQRIKSRDTDAVIFTEDKVLKVLANKDALYNADGDPKLVSTNRVLGQVVPYAGDYGISKNPESLAWDQYRMYFTDKARGAVLRLSMDGLTPISDVGMSGWFRKQLPNAWNAVGSFDIVAKNYNLTLKFNKNYTYNYNWHRTISFNEKTKGWVSFKSFIPTQAVSVNGKYFSIYDHKIWEHNKDSANRNSFYGKDLVPSQITVMFNDNPSIVKSFRTMNYEGSQAKITSFTGEVQEHPNGDINFSGELASSAVMAAVNLNDNEYYNIFDKSGWWCDGCQTDLQRGSDVEFKNKEGKWFARVPKEPLQVTYSENNNVDTSEITVQGIGVLSSVVVTAVVDPIDPDDDDGGDGTIVLGCMDFNSDNYNPDATLDDGSCNYGILGCMDPASPSYDPSATIHSATDCDSYIIGCMSGIAYNYNPYATQEGYCLAEDGVTVVTCGPDASTFVVAEDYGCIFDTFVVDDPDDTVIEVYGCMDPFAGNYNADATINAVSADDMTTNPCNYIGVVDEVSGCTEPGACNYNQFANVNDGSCEYLTCQGCMEYGYFNYSPIATIPCPDNNGDGIPDCCCMSYWECTEGPDDDLVADDEDIIEPDPTDTSSDCPDGQIFVLNINNVTNTLGECEDIIYGCMDEDSAGYNPLANVEDGTCVEVFGDQIFGCTDPLALLNYNPLANVDDGSCLYNIYGCMDDTMWNYNEEATDDDGSCIPFIYGCMESTALNYNPDANTSAPCIDIVYGCMDENANNYNPDANVEETSADDNSNPCSYFTVADSTPLNITVQNYPGDSDSQDQ